MAGCTTAKITQADIDATIKAIAPEVPDRPVMEAVRFFDLSPGASETGGLGLSYQDYRALERNIITLREYAAQLETIIAFYRGEE